VSHLTLDSNPIHLPSSKGAVPLDKSKDLAIASTQPVPVSTPGSQDSADKFEQARLAFFSK
jgi:hypothetical protein